MGIEANNNGSSSWVLIALVSLIGAFMSILDSTIVDVAITTIMHVFSTNTTTVQWIVTIYMLTLGVVVPWSGWMGNRFGLKKIYIFSLAIFTLGSALCSLSWNINSLIAARVIQALGGGMIMPTTMAMISEAVPREKFGSAMGIFGISLMMAPAIGPTLGGYLVEYVDWRWIFTVNIPIGLLGVLLAFFILPEFKGNDDAGKVDVAGGITSSIGLFCLLLALSKSSDWGWGDEKTVLLLYTSVVALGLFVYLELTCEHPLLNLRVFKYRNFTMANIILIAVTISLNAGVFYVSLFLQNVRGLGAMDAGMLQMAAALASGLLMPIIGALYDRIGPKFMAFAGLSAFLYAQYLFHQLSLDTPFNLIRLWLIFRSVGMSFGMMPAQTAALADIPPEMAGEASAITNIISRVSGSFGIAVLTSVINNRQTMYAERLAEHINPSNMALSNLSNKLGGSSTLAYEALQGLVSQNSYVKAIDDMFIIMCIMVIPAIFLSLFLKKGNKKSAHMSVE
ncbi:DHA2 family efflux MFS transporter permease subunit [Thermoanaerobacterium thermosaccharolyticum]|uniref:DHA2 family efflux MFS transporter permease subunit n=1 Tax=Thermoanaerobacterium thermosaccharolyticum TaxID=1517 RepID=UPI001786BAD0|nr:DHA2 family efflux MFS transporter permease subunit [Thermoanaerobacterium thermosaccharolyticum]MBE0067950.1 DHA2 family efflux MFS transporter permease subunit [Thermoanaerobacterium thermosaccharolyticum]MBE0227688.1 DHA2 family efflux MFS transporter permease subunit [Thermoanaerobacterium thermosaccharolyticum]